MLGADAITALSDAAAGDDPDAHRLAVVAGCRLPLDEEAWRSLAPVLHEALDRATPGTPDRAELLAAAARAPLTSIFERLAAIAADPDDRDSRLVIHILGASLGDLAIERLRRELTTGAPADVLEILASLPLEEGTLSRSLVRPFHHDGDPDVRLWAALVTAKLGRVRPLRRVVTAMRSDDVPTIFWGDPWSAYDRLARARPLPQAVHGRVLGWLTEELPHPARLLVWAVTGVADAEGTPAPPAEHPPTRRQAVPARSTEAAPPDAAPQASSADRATEARRAAQTLLDHPFGPDGPTLGPDAQATLRHLPAGVAADVVATVVEAAEALDAEPGEFIGNRVVEVVAALPAGLDLPVERILRAHGAAAPPTLSDRQIAWTLGRASPDRLVGRFDPLLRDPDTRLPALRLLADAAGQAGAAAPFEGAGPEGLQMPASPPPWDGAAPDTGSDDVELPTAPPAPPTRLERERPPEPGGAVPQGSAPRGQRAVRRLMSLPSALVRRSMRELRVEQSSQPSATRAAWPALDCDDTVIVGQPFDLTVGIAAERDPKVHGTGELTLPAGEIALEVALSLDGFAIASGERTVELQVSDAYPYPTETLTLVAIGGDQYGPHRRIAATYFVGGEMRGFATRDVTVVASRAEAHATGTSAPHADHPGDIDLGQLDLELAADLTLAVRHGDARDGRTLVWQAASPIVELDWPDEEVKTRLLAVPRDDTAELIRKASTTADATDLLVWLRGRGRRIADAMPEPVHAAIRRVVAARAPDPPSILIASEDPYMPWELAAFDPPLDGPGGTSPFLAAHTAIGRWMLSMRRPPPRPPRSVDVNERVVVTAVYDAVPGWNRLEDAEREASDLTAAYPGTKQIDATFDAVLACLGGQPPGDVLHFALHGQVDTGAGLQEGLVLLRPRDDKPDRMTAAFLQSDHVLAHDLPRPSFVFLNACQVGAAKQVLGDYAGMAAAFLAAGASAVVAPLWSIDDEVARHIALGFYADASGADGRPPVRPAEILRRDRASLGMPTEGSQTAPDGKGAGTWLAYQFFGHPNFRLTKTD